MTEYGFTEKQDFVSITQKRVTAQGNETTFTDYAITIDMAKQLCMIQRTLTRRCTNGYDAEYVRKYGENVIKSNVRTLCDRHKTKFQEMQELEESTDIINL